MAKNADFEYVGGELELFAHATTWKEYWSRVFRPYMAGDVLEVGAGMGSNTALLRSASQGKWTCLEPDPKLVSKLHEALAEKRIKDSCRVVTGTISNLGAQELFDTILYVDVLEHIEDDRAELTRAANHLRPNGRVIVLSPAYQWLYSEFDKSIGHCRRYARRTLLAVSPDSLRLIRCFYLDSCGLIASLANRLFLRQSLPTERQILFWDRTVVPVSRLLDPFLLHKAGKSIIAVWQRVD
jgi:SAM-dependent methyltransferase